MLVERGAGRPPLGEEDDVAEDEVHGEDPLGGGPLDEEAARQVADVPQRPQQQEVRAAPLSWPRGRWRRPERTARVGNAPEANTKIIV